MASPSEAGYTVAEKSRQAWHTGGPDPRTHAPVNFAFSDMNTRIRHGSEWVKGYKSEWGKKGLLERDSAELEACYLAAALLSGFKLPALPGPQCPL